MRSFLKHHALQVLVAAGMLAGAWWAHQRWIFVDNFGAVAEGVLYRCRQPVGGQWRLVATWRLLERHRIASVVNLRAADQSPDQLDAEERACSRAGALLIHIPIRRLVPTDAQVRAFLSAVLRSPGPVLVHCEHGEDRSGMMVAAWRVKVQGMAHRQGAQGNGAISRAHRRTETPPGRAPAARHPGRTVAASRNTGAQPSLPTSKHPNFPNMLFDSNSKPWVAYQVHQELEVFTNKAQAELMYFDGNAWSRPIQNNAPHCLAHCGVPNPKSAMGEAPVSGFATGCDTWSAWSQAPF